MRALRTLLAIGLALAAVVPVRAFQGVPAESAILDISRPIPYFISDGRGVPGYEAGDRDLARSALDAWAAASEGRLQFVESASEDEAVIRLIWVPPGGGLFGEIRRARMGGQTRVSVYVIPEVEGHGPAISRVAGEDALLRDTIVYLTCLHELGHAIGLPHTSDYADIMYSFAYGGNILEYFMRYRRLLETRGDIASHWGLSSNDIARLGEFYGREP